MLSEILKKLCHLYGIQIPYNHKIAEFTLEIYNKVKKNTK